MLPAAVPCSIEAAPRQNSSSRRGAPANRWTRTFASWFVLVWFTTCDQLDRVLCAVLRVDALRDEVQVGVEKDEVVVVGGGAERIVPLQNAGERPARRHDDPVESVASAGREVVDLPVRPRGGEEVLLDVLRGFVAGGGVIRNARRHGGVDGCGHGAILEERLAEEPQVVDDHVRRRRRSGTGPRRSCRGCSPAR